MRVSSTVTKQLLDHIFCFWCCFCLLAGIDDENHQEGGISSVHNTEGFQQFVWSCCSIHHSTWWSYYLDEWVVLSHSIFVGVGQWLYCGLVGYSCLYFCIFWYILVWIYLMFFLNNSTLIWPHNIISPPNWHQWCILLVLLPKDAQHCWRRIYHTNDVVQYGFK